MKRKRPALLSIPAIVVVAWLVGCNGAPGSGPPELRLGRDECGECGMLINEDRCSCAVLIDRDGRRDYVVFDDIGCMLDWDRKGRGGAVVIEHFVHDYASRAWVAAADAAYLAAEPRKLATPMSSGIAAFATRASAERSQQKHGGVLFDFRALVAAQNEQDAPRRAAAQSAGD